MEQDLIAFRKGLRRIDEGGVNRILSHGKYGFIVISANRSEIYSDNPNNDLSDEYEEWCKIEKRDVEDNKNMNFWLQKRNKQADNDLLKDLKTSKFSYTPVYGGYHGTDDVTDSFEPSYIVYNHAKEDSSAYLNFNELYDFALTLCRKYNQDSVYVQAPNEAPIYVDCNGNKVSGQSSKNFKINDYTQMFYTTAKREKRSGKDYNDSLITQPQRFTADIQFESMYRKASPSTYFDRMKRYKLGEIFIDK